MEMERSTSIILVLTGSWEQVDFEGNQKRNPEAPFLLLNTDQIPITG